MRSTLPAAAPGETDLLGEVCAPDGILPITGERADRLNMVGPLAK